LAAVPLPVAEAPVEPVPVPLAPVGPVNEDELEEVVLPAGAVVEPLDEAEVLGAELVVEADPAPLVVPAPAAPAPLDVVLPPLVAPAPAAAPPPPPAAPAPPPPELPLVLLTVTPPLGSTIPSASPTGFRPTGIVCVIEFEFRSQ
jgi:hypothetical protein